MNPIIGKKVILFEIEPRDFPDFAKLHREDEKGFMQRMCLKKMTQEEAEQYVAALMLSLQLQAFTIMTKEGKASRRVGYIYISDLTEYGCSIAGMMSKDFVSGLGRQLRRGKYTFTEDALNTLVEWCFKTFGKMRRIEMTVVEKNRLSLALAKRAGFTQEGTLREYLHIDDRAENVIVHSVLRNEWSRRVIRTEEATHNQSAGVQEADPSVV